MLQFENKNKLYLEGYKVQSKDILFNRKHVSRTTTNSLSGYCEVTMSLIEIILVHGICIEGDDAL